MSDDYLMKSKKKKLFMHKKSNYLCIYDCLFFDTMFLRYLSELLKIKHTFSHGRIIEED